MGGLIVENVLKEILRKKRIMSQLSAGARLIHCSGQHATILRTVQARFRCLSVRFDSDSKIQNLEIGEDALFYEVLEMQDICGISA